MTAFSNRELVTLTIALNGWVSSEVALVTSSVAFHDLSNLSELLPIWSSGMMALLKGFPADPVPSPSPSLCSTRWALGLFSQAGPNPSQQLVHAAPSAWKPFLPVALLRDLLGILAETGPMPPPWMPLSLCFSPLHAHQLPLPASCSRGGGFVSFTVVSQPRHLTKATPS